MLRCPTSIRVRIRRVLLNKCVRSAGCPNRLSTPRQLTVFTHADARTSIVPDLVQAVTCDPTNRLKMTGTARTAGQSVAVTAAAAAALLLLM